MHTNRPATHGREQRVWPAHIAGNGDTRTFDKHSIMQSRDKMKNIPFLSDTVKPISISLTQLSHLQETESHLSKSPIVSQELVS